MTYRKLVGVALAAVIASTQLACYNTYTIDKNELQKLESSVDRYEIVEVLADCPEGLEEATNTSPLHGTMYAEAEAPSEEAAISDARIRRVDTDDLRGCTKVPVSTVNALTVLTTRGDQRVTPFNFVMDNIQLVSPEYNVLVQLDQVHGAEVREFSGTKTALAISGVSLVTIGTFVGIWLGLGEDIDW